MVSNPFRFRRVALVALAFFSAAVALSNSNRFQPAAAQDKTDCPVRVTLLQVNDVYQFSPVDKGKHGGLARVLTLRKQIMSESPNTLMLFSGDTISPSVESETAFGGQKLRGRQMIEAWNLLGLDYAALGNHEFDFGVKVLRERISESTFKWLGANVIDKQTGKLFADTPEFVIRKFEGVNVGIFGLLLPDTLKTSRTEGAVDIREPCETAARVIPKIRAAGAQVIVALTHLSLAEDKRLARCSGVDVIIGGHEHDLMGATTGPTPIFKMASDARDLGQIDLYISRTTGKVENIDWKIHRVDETVAPDAAFASLNEKYGPLLKSLDEVVGRTEVPLKMGSVRRQESNMASFIADLYRQSTGADVALLNGGSIRAETEIPTGELTRRDVLGILPYNNKIVKIEISGAVLRAALEYGVASLDVKETNPGRFPQVSGMRYTFDTGLEPGKRLKEVTVNGKPLEDGRTYTLATSEYVALHAGDGYENFKGAKVLIGPDKAQSEADVLMKALTSGPISPKEDGRIKRLNVVREKAVCKQ